MNCSMPGFLVLYSLPEFPKTHVHWVSMLFYRLIIYTLLQSFPPSGSFPVSQLFTSGGQYIGAPVSASVFPINVQHWFTLGWLVWALCSARDSQESSPAPQFKSISSSALGLPYGPALTSVNDWKNHSFDSLNLYD